jgi:thioredoxin reductase
MVVREILPVVVVGAGPIGLVAAAHLAQRGLPFLVLEAGPDIATSVRRWSHVRMFSPWHFDLDPVAVSLLTSEGWSSPDPESYPTGGEFIARFLEPLARHPLIRPALRFSHRVTAIGRLGRDKLSGHDRAGRPFAVRVMTPTGEQELLARAVLDASGAIPNPLGGSGWPAIGERACTDSIDYGMPDVLGRDRARYAGARTLVVGAGHSAFGTLLDLVSLAEQEPGTFVHWAIRRRSLAGRLGSLQDELPERGRLGQRLAAALEADRIVLHRGILVDRLERTSQGIVVFAGERALPPVDRIVCATGYRPDLELLRELRLALDTVVEAPVALAPAIDPALHSCGTVPPHGVEELTHPQEPDFFVVGLKSYGRAPTFLLRTGYEQVRSIVAALAGDWEAARRVELRLPATGVCGGEKGEACCSERGVTEKETDQPTAVAKRPLLLVGGPERARLRPALEISGPACPWPRPSKAEQGVCCADRADEPVCTCESESAGQTCGG